MCKNLKKYIFLICFVFVFPVFAQTLTSEIIDLRSENNVILIDVAKKYPNVKISQFQNPNKVLIELLETSFHKTFSFDGEAEGKFLKGLSFANGIIVGAAKYIDDDVEKQKISIILDVKDTSSLKPKLQSTKNNVVSISFLPVDSNVAVSEVKVTSKETENQPLESQVHKLYNSAVEEQTNGNPDYAEKLYKEVLLKDESFYLAALNLSKIYVDKKNYDQAINLLHELTEKIQKSVTSEQIKNDNLTYLFSAISNIYYLKDSLDEAESILNQLLKINPSSYQAYFNLGLIFEKRKGLDKAKSHFEKVIELRPDFSDAYYHIGVLDLIKKNKKDAIARFKKVVELTPESTVAELSKKELEKIEKK